jgi:arylformamidase
MARIDPDWLNLQYNNRARIPEHPQIFERWAEASALVRDRRAALLDLTYGNGPNETLDVFPTSQPNAPVLVFIHGGWWRSLDKADHSFIAPAFTDAGAMVVVPNYALCPAVHIETIALQMVRALAWTFRNAALHGGDPRRIVVAGHSAGGHLAAMLMCCDWAAVGADLPATTVPAALAISGVFDLAPVRHTPFLQADLRLTAASVARLSPVRFAPPAGRLFAAVGADESDEFLHQTALIQQAWGPRCVPVREHIAGANHLTVLHDLAEPRGRLHTLALQLLGLGPWQTPGQLKFVANQVRI